MRKRVVAGIAVICGGLLVAPVTTAQTRDRDVRPGLLLQSPDLFRLLGPGAEIGVSVRELTADEITRARLEQAGGVYVEAVRDGSPAARERQQARIARFSAMYIVLYALGFSLIAFDMMIALQPHWFSNLLGGFYFMGSFLGGHMLLALTMMYGERQLGIADLISPKQRHDLGKLCFGFTVFWAYLMWSQFLVIWYGNMHEETGFVLDRKSVV